MIKVSTFLFTLDPSHFLIPELSQLPAAALDLIEQLVFPQPGIYVAPVSLRPFRFGHDRVQALVESAFESLS